MYILSQLKQFLNVEIDAGSILKTEPSECATELDGIEGGLRTSDLLACANLNAKPYENSCEWKMKSLVLNMSTFHN